MNFRYSSILSLVLILGAFCSTGNADNSAGTTGRFRDGTAYRTDSAGNKLADYVAELEVTNAELRRQLTVAEGQAGGKALNGFPAPACPVCQYTQTSVSQAVNLAVTEERTRCDQQLRTISIENRNTAATNCEQQAERRIAETQTELNKKLSRLEEENQAISQQLIDTQDRLALAEKRDLQRASLKPSLNSAPIAASAATARTEPTSKKSFSAELATIQNLITSRKSLLDSLRAKRPNITLSPQNLVTKEGTSLDMLRSQIASGGGAKSEAKINQDLAEIQAILRDDITVLSRLVNG